MLIHLQMRELNGPAYSMVLVVFVVMAGSPTRQTLLFLLSHCKSVAILC